MPKLLLFILFFCISCSTENKKSKLRKSDFFILKKISNYSYTIDFNSTPSLFDLKNNKIDSDTNYQVLGFYYLVRKYNQKQQLRMIEELLEFEGNNKKSFYTSGNHNPNKDMLIPENMEINYSIQVEALYMINQIYFENPFYYSPIHILENKVTNCNKESMILKKNSNTSEESSTNGFVVEKAYESYKKWFKKVKKKGLNKARKEDLKPLDNSSIQWRYGIDISPDSIEQLDDIISHFNLFK